MKRIKNLHCDISCWCIPFPREKMCTVLPLTRSVADRYWNGKKFPVCLTDRKKWKFFYRNCVRETHFLWNWQNWGMTIFLRKNLFTKEETHFIQKQRARISMIFRKIRAFLFAGYSVFLQKPFLTATVISDFINALLSANLAGTAKRKGGSAAEHIFFCL